MKCLTICQPYAHLIVTPQDELPDGHVVKRIENRTWRTHYTGPLLIHAGKSRAYLKTYPIEAELVFGAVVGMATLVDCAPWGEVCDRPHAEGPWCWILEDVATEQNKLLGEYEQGQHEDQLNNPETEIDFGNPQH